MVVQLGQSFASYDSFGNKVQISVGGIKSLFESLPPSV